MSFDELEVRVSYHFLWRKWHHFPPQNDEGDVRRKSFGTFNLSGESQSVCLFQQDESKKSIESLSTSPRKKGKFDTAGIGIPFQLPYHLPVTLYHFLNCWSSNNSKVNNGVPQLTASDFLHKKSWATANLKNSDSILISSRLILKQIQTATRKLQLI